MSHTELDSGPIFFQAKSSKLSCEYKFYIFNFNVVFFAHLIYVYFKIERLIITL
jgi:hypothetical protein